MYGIFSYDTANQRVGYKHADHILDLEAVGQLGYFNDLDLDPTVFTRPTLNDFIALGKPTWIAVGKRIQQLLTDDVLSLTDVRAQVLIHESRATLHLPVRIGNYTDFYAGIHHAENVGRCSGPVASRCFLTTGTCRWRITGGRRALWYLVPPSADQVAKRWTQTDSPFLVLPKRWILNSNWG